MVAGLWLLGLSLVSSGAEVPLSLPKSTVYSPFRDELVQDGAENYRKTVDYALEAELLAEAKMVKGRGQVRWTNHGSQPVQALWWHLYLNAFSSNRSSFMRESGRDGFDDDAWGGIQVERMTARLVETTTAAQDPVDLLAGRSFEHPDDDNADDRTVMRTPLPFAVMPGQTVEVQMAFIAHMPRVVARTGYAGDFFLVAQWFPKLGVLQETIRPLPAGESPRLDAYGEPAWNCHQFHAHTEFFADYGHYRVALTVPGPFVVGATGLLQRKETLSDGRTVHEYVQDRVHDFAWTAYPRFVEQAKTFRMQDEVTDAEREEVAGQLGLDPQDLVLPDVEVRVLVAPEHVACAPRYFRATFAAIKWFGLWFGPYPYQTLTVVDGPRGAGSAMGMEYPTFMTGGVFWPAPDDVARPENVTIHEFGHQYWYGLVGSNEFEESWLDEGVNTYSTGKVVQRAYPPFIALPNFGVAPTHWLVPGWRLTAPEVVRLGTMRGPDEDRIVRPAWMYRGSRSYRVNSYSRPALTLHQLENELGPEVVVRALRLFQLRYRYRHPNTEDFIAVVEEVAGHSMQEYFQRALFSEGKVDYGISELTSQTRRAWAGRDAEEKQQDESSAADGDVYETKVVIRRYGEVDFPVTVAVQFEDGTVVRRAWDGRYRWQAFRFTGASKAVSARIWARRDMLLDMHPVNDTLRIESRALAGVTWGSHVLYAVQTIFQVLGGLL